ncbi:MAG: TIGR04282 family arsenosugar biosynthesis glycosyltransferase, partial [Actinomycetota bacterium]
MSLPGFRILVFAKAPRVGRSKTRLCPPCTPLQAAILAEAMLTDTLRAVAATPAARRVLVLEGSPGPWLPAGFEVLLQRGEGQAARLAAGFEDAGGPALLIGMDTPQVTPALLVQATAQLSAPGVDAVLGIAADGGWWALGLRRPDPSALEGVPMGSPRTGDCQRRRLHELGLAVAELPMLQDVDEIADAFEVAAAIPGSAFETALSALPAPSWT